MNGLRFVPGEWIQTEDLLGDVRIVARDTEGRRATLPVPGSRMAVEALQAVIGRLKWKVDRVEVRSILSSRGGEIVLRRWLFRRRIRAHAALAVALALECNAAVWLDERLFGTESYGSAETESERAPASLRVVH